MAKEEQLKILKQGVKAWNKWRVSNSQTLIDFSGCDLKGIYLGGADLRDVNLSKTDLTFVNLSEAKLVYGKLNSALLSQAHLREADLSGAELLWAKLDDATLTHADLRDANIINADLKNTHLQRANFTGANLSGTNIAHARLLNTIFGKNDLSLTKGLDSVLHYGPSTIGIDTIYESNGNIPEVFLRGCGVPDIFISYAHSLVGKAIEYYSAFISYSSKNQDFAERLYAELQNKAVRCWFAPEDLKIGDKFRQRIDESIRLHDKLLLILSGQSISSAWVEEEVESAFERERRENRLVLFPIRIDDAVINSEQAWAASLQRMRHIGDFTRWKDHDAYQKAFTRLLRDLKAEESK
jgi:hypothetical protein